MILRIMVGDYWFNFKTIFMDEAKMDELKKDCVCGSGEMSGKCCKGGELCPCGSGNKVSACCLA